MQGPLIAITVEHVGKAGVVVIMVLLILGPIVAVGRAKKLDQKFPRLPLKNARE